MEDPSSSAEESSYPTPRGEDGHPQDMLDIVNLIWTTYDYGRYTHSFPSDTDFVETPTNYSTPSDRELLRLQVNHYLRQFVIPVIFGVGILGNAANLFLLTSHRLYPHRRQTTQMERSAVMGLKTLAASDLLFCLVGFPYPFVQGYGRTSSGPMTLFNLYYLMHYHAFINVFLFTSTWLIMLVSVERYIAICHPFRAASLIRVRRTVCAHLLVFVVSALINIPLFLNHSIKTLPCGNTSLFDKPSICYFAQRSQYFTPGFENLHYIIWFTVGTVVPLLLILASNALLIREIYHKSSNAVVHRGGSGMGASVSSGSSRSRSSHLAESEKTSTSRLTMTLLAVVFFFIIFVCPSMLLQFVRFVDRQGSLDKFGRSVVVGPSGTEAFIWAVNIANLTQAVKFSSNFLLYCAINRTFRQTFARLVRGDSCRTQNEHLQQQQQQQQLQQQQQENGGKEMKPPCEVIQMIEK